MLARGVAGHFLVQSVAEKLDAGLLEVVCVGYGLFTRNQDTLAKYNWLLVVFDEVHLLKSPTSQRCGTMQQHDSAYRYMRALVRLKNECTPTLAVTGGSVGAYSSCVAR